MSTTEQDRAAIAAVKAEAAALLTQLENKEREIEREIAIVRELRRAHYELVSKLIDHHQPVFITQDGTRIRITPPHKPTGFDALPQSEGGHMHEYGPYGTTQPGRTARSNGGD
jgi:hypothetical protein